MIEITENELVSGDHAIHAAHRPRARRAARGSPSTTPAPATPGSRTSCASRPTSSSSTARSSIGVDATPSRRALISSFVRYARDIDAIVCAEGIETLAELDASRRRSTSTYGQGYGIARPAPPSAPVDLDSAQRFVDR